MDFVNFSPMTTSVKLAGITGLMNGYKMLEVVHGGRHINLRPQNYYYVPHIRRIVTYKATVAREMKINKMGKLNLRDSVAHGYSKTVQVDAHVLYQSAADRFN